jgi:FlaA1/EpsC-like NDP-sugar epimerase
VGPSRGALILNGLILLTLVSASRLLFRWVRTVPATAARSKKDAQQVLVYGAGDRGELLILEILNNPEYHYTILGFVDDDADKVGKRLHGYPIFSSGELPKLVQAHHVQQVFVSTPKILETHLSSLRALGVATKTMTIRLEEAAG